MSIDNKHYVDLWTKQSQLFWQTVYQVPIISGAMFAGWFALKSTSQDLLAEALLVVGVMSMVVQVLILKRMSQYLNTFRQAAGNLIPSVPPAFLRLTGYILGTAVPALIGLFFLGLLVWSPEFNKAPHNAFGFTSRQNSSNGSGFCCSGHGHSCVGSTKRA